MFLDKFDRKLFKNPKVANLVQALFEMQTELKKRKEEQLIGGNLMVIARIFPEEKAVIHDFLKTESSTQRRSSTVVTRNRNTPRGTRVVRPYRTNSAVQVKTSVEGCVDCGNDTTTVTSNTQFTATGKTPPNPIHKPNTHVKDMNIEEFRLRYDTIEKVDAVATLFGLDLGRTTALHSKVTRAFDKLQQWKAENIEETVEEIEEAEIVEEDELEDINLHNLDADGEMEDGVPPDEDEMANSID